MKVSHPFRRTNQLTSPLPSSPWVSDLGFVWGFVFVFLEVGAVAGCQTLPAADSQAGTSAHIPSWFIREAANLPFWVPLRGKPLQRLSLLLVGTQPPAGGDRLDAGDAAGELEAEACDGRKPLLVPPLPELFPRA